MPRPSRADAGAGRGVTAQIMRLRIKHIVDGDHTLAFRVEGNFVLAWVGFVDDVIHLSGLGRGHEQGPLGRVADRMEVARLVGLRREDGVVAQRASGEEDGQRGPILRHARPMIVARFAVFPASP